VDCIAKCTRDFPVAHHIGFEWSNDLSLAIPSSLAASGLHQVEDSRRARSRSAASGIPASSSRECLKHWRGLQTDTLRMLQVTRIVKKPPQFSRFRVARGSEFGSTLR